MSVKKPTKRQRIEELLKEITDIKKYNYQFVLSVRNLSNRYKNIIDLLIDICVKNEYPYIKTDGLTFYIKTNHRINIHEKVNFGMSYNLFVKDVVYDVINDMYIVYLSYPEM